ncbi:MAG TPA: hypothetical protein VGO67_15095 [Verrucomicrobiae bacterium]
MILQILFSLLIVGWVVQKMWEIRFSERTGLPPKCLWRNPKPADIRRRTVELEQKIEQIEKLVGFDNDPAAAASTFEGLVDWEDFVDPGFEREKSR